ncbi:hypothetical protein MKEN_00744700 [Mycena kentingensis (nom. inval.)]|nr:hypothetical protein MKEN_00744700 [Mycena kentingensis (nom. inval.)]
MPPKRKQLSTTSSKSNSSIVSRSAAAIVKGAKKVVDKAVGFVSPRKSTTKGSKSDTPRRKAASQSAAPTGERSLRSSSRASSNASVSSRGTVESHQSSFQMTRRKRRGEELSQEERDKRNLEKLRRSWTSPIYVFYKGDVRIEYRDGKLHHVFVCAARGCGHSVSRNQTTKDRNSSKNLTKHAKKCWGADTVEAARRLRSLPKARELLEKHKGSKTQRITDIFKQHTPGGEVISNVPLTKSETRTGVVRWVAESLRPFAIVADRGFRYLMKSGRPTMWIPSPSTVSRDADRLFNATQRRLKRRLMERDGQVGLATDAWTSPNHRAFVAVTAHWEEDGKKVDCLLDFVEVPQSHSGEHLARVLFDVADAYGIAGRIASVTCDNASNNDTMIDALADLFPTFCGAPQRTRCFAHIINLVAKSFLRLFDPAQKDGDDDSDGENELPDLEELLGEMDELERTAAEEDDADDIFDERAEMLDAERERFSEETKAVNGALGKIRTLANKIINSPTILLPRWHAVVESNSLPPRVLARDVKTRWNSTYDMINVALTYRRAVHALTLEQSNGLTAFYLSEEEWNILSDLRDLLLAFKDATLYFSRDSATIATVIPTMDKLDSMLATAILTRPDKKQKTFMPAIQIALVYAKRTLNRYYSKAYYNQTQRMCLILHPRYKTGYMRDHEWEEDDIKAAVADLRTHYEQYVEWAKEAGVADGDDASSMMISEVHSTHSSTSSANMWDQMEVDDDAAAAVVAENVDELTLYLNEPRVKGITDVLLYWAASADKYPVLSRIARDQLACPPTSVYVERQFSRGRLLVSSIRNRLSAQTIRKLMCLGCWSRQGMVADEDYKVVAALPTVEEDAAQESESESE